MKKLIFFIFISFQAALTFAQFGGGTGTEGDPYRIYTKAHLEEMTDSIDANIFFEGKHFRLMNDINDSLTETIPVLYASFHGGGYTINVNMNNFYNTNSLFDQIYGCLDSIIMAGILESPIGFAGTNYGTIYACINNTRNNTYVNNVLLGENYSGICLENGENGNIISCINNSDIYGESYTAGICTQSIPLSLSRIENCINNGNITSKYGNAAGVVLLSCNTVISNCINRGDITQTHANTTSIGSNLGGICGYFDALENMNIINCQNYGNVSAKAGASCAGIAATIYNATIENCSNYGNILGDDFVGGIYGNTAYINQDTNINRIVKNCFNSGKVAGATHTGGIGGTTFTSTSSSDTVSVKNCLNIANLNKPAILSNDDNIQINPAIYVNNFYDKQMCRSKGINGEDISGVAEGKLSTQLVENSPELQAMLGNGWSYAEGRYPIPLSLENDSMALVAATPVFLAFEDENNYNHVDSVTKNFTVTTGVSTGSTTSVTFNWEDEYGKVSFNNQYVTLLDLGLEKLTVSLGNYSKDVRIHILDTEPIDIQENITEKGIAIYPNPASNYININLNGVSADKMEICDISGKLLSSKTITYSQEDISIENIKPGMYFMNIYAENKRLATIKFLKE